MTPRDVLPRKPGVNIGFLPNNDRRPRRGVSVPVVLKSVKSSISGGSWLNFETGASCDMVLEENRLIVWKCHCARADIFSEKKAQLSSLLV
jgi:hypothetical protein